MRVSIVRDNVYSLKLTDISIYTNVVKNSKLSLICNIVLYSKIVEWSLDSII